MNELKRAVVFDMDGVLIDSEPLHYQALHEVLAAEGHNWTEQDNERLLGTTVPDTFRIIGDTIPLENPPEAYIETYEAMVLGILEGELQAAPGVASLLEALKERRMPLAVASSSRRSWVDATLRSLEIRDYFSSVITGDDVENGKPAPDIYLLTAETLGFSPAACCAIEDAPNGILAAKRAGMRVVAVRTLYTQHLSLDGADRLVNSLLELDVSALLS